MTDAFQLASAKWAHLSFSITDEDLAILKRDLAAGDCDLCSFPVVFQLIGSLEDARHSAEPERRQAEPPIIGYHERPGDQLALGEVITEPSRGATRSCPRCGTHTRWTGYAWEHMSEGMTGASPLSCPIPPVESRPCGCKVWPCQHEGAYLLDGEPLTTEPLSEPESVSATERKAGRGPVFGPEPRHAEAPIIGYHERPGDRLALSKAVAAAPCPLCFGPWRHRPVWPND